MIVLKNEEPGNHLQQYNLETHAYEIIKAKKKRIRLK